MSLAGTKIFRCCLVAITVAMCGLPVSANAEGEHSRRAATELLVLSGDIQKLANNNPSDLHSKGLKERIAGGLAGLEILLRLADQETGRNPVDYTTDLSNIRKSWLASNYSAMTTGVGGLQILHPFAANGILPAKDSKAAIIVAKELHDDLCAACHNDPDLEVSRPAYSLFKEARRMPVNEFAARMVVGVRGDRITGIDNPLSDAQISALIYYYKSVSIAE